jgi:oligopeptide transport system permease protein
MRRFLGFLAWRLLGAAVVIGAVITILFFLVRAVPGDPFATEKAGTPAIKEIVRQKYGLDRPLGEQYLRFMANVVRLDFGPSYRYKSWTVGQILRQGFPISAFLGLCALALSVGFGVTAGALAASRKNTWIDHLTMGTVVAGICVPAFFLAPLLVIGVSLLVPIFPPAGWGSPGQLLLPVFVLALPNLAYISRLTRAGVLEALQADYIRTAKAKGLAERRVLYEHALRNGIMPVLTFLAPATAYIVTGSFVVETIFHVPGMGKYFVSSFLHSDYPLAVGSIAVYSAILVFLNLAVDIAQFYLDPRVKLA